MRILAGSLIYVTYYLCLAVGLFELTMMITMFSFQSLKLDFYVQGQISGSEIKFAYLLKKTETAS